MGTTFYARLQLISLLPVAAFVWTGMADASLGWSGTVPFTVDWSKPGHAAWILGATVVETIVPVGLLFERTRAAAALFLSGYVLLAGFNAYAGLGSTTSLQLQPLFRTIAVAGALLFVFAATQLGVHRACDRK